MQAADKEKQDAGEGRNVEHVALHDETAVDQDHEDVAASQPKKRARKSARARLTCQRQQASTDSQWEDTSKLNEQEAAFEAGGGSTKRRQT